MKQFSFRKDVKIENIDDLMHVYASASPLSCPDDPEGQRQFWEEIGEQFEPDDDLQRMIQAYTSYVDPRSKYLGIRTITMEGGLEIEADANEIQQEGPDVYRYLRILLGIPEGPSIIGEIPHKLNFHMLNTLHFTKGCYIGQELIARTHTQGVVRTLTYPFIASETVVPFSDVGTPPIELVDYNYRVNLNGKKIIDVSGNVIGIIFESVKNIGLLKLKGGLKSNEYKTENGIRIIVWQPSWAQTFHAVNTDTEILDI